MVLFFLFKIQNGKWHFAFQIGIWNGFIWNSYPALDSYWVSLEIAKVMYLISSDFFQLLLCTCLEWKKVIFINNCKINFLQIALAVCNLFPAPGGCAGEEGMLFPARRGTPVQPYPTPCCYEPRTRDIAGGQTLKRLVRSSVNPL